eukprot:XP_024467391.1 receptor-like protein 9DC3 [Populus trichocarpa]
MIDDTFPSFLETLPKLKVVILRSNKLRGSLKGPTVKDSFSKLQIFDLSNNSLSGPLPTEYFNNFKAMMSIDQDMDYMRTKNVSTTYVYSVQLAWKGSKTLFPKIQIALTTLDLSCNKFTGKIPESLGKLKSLKQLNLSHNSLIGCIQPSMGNLTNLEWLDLSSNLLAGRIPQELVDLTFLQVLNLSYNQLEGPIPQGKQFNTFENGSYEGNLGLCGFPLQVKCNKGEGQQPPPSNFEKQGSMFEEGFGWKAVTMGYGCGFVFGVSIGYVVFRARKAAWFVKMVEDSAHQYGKRLRRKNAPRNGGTQGGVRRWGRRQPPTHPVVDNGSSQEEGIIFQAVKCKEMVHAQRREGETNLVAEAMLKTMANTPCDAGGGGEAADERGVWEKDDELRKEGGGVGENGGLLMRGKGCWRLGGSVTEISKTREAAGGWLRLEDEGMKKRWKGRGAGVFFGRLRGRRKTKGKKLDSGRRDCWQGKPCGDNGIRDKP